MFKKKVLIVNNDRSFPKTLRDGLESLGYSCTIVGSVCKALQILEETDFHLVISDAITPENHGMELLRTIKGMHADVDVLVITGYRSQYSPREIIQAGASDFLIKPFGGVRELVARLERIEREITNRGKLHSATLTDHLTGLYNRRSFYQILNRETERAKRQGFALSMLLLDVDGFKRYNDRYGHLKGDEVLKTVATVLRCSIREHVDCAFRYGGDEFVVILPETDKKTAEAVGNRINVKFRDIAPFGLVLSTRAAEFHKDFDSETLVQLIDERIYKDRQKSEQIEQSQIPAHARRNREENRWVACDRLVDQCSCFCEHRLADSEKGQSERQTLSTGQSSAVRDRRAVPRIKIRKTFLYNSLLATIQNISRGGIQIKTGKPLPLDKMLKMAFKLDDTMEKLTGSVVYARLQPDGEALVGVRFSNQNSQTLNRFLDAHLARSACKSGRPMM